MPVESRDMSVLTYDIKLPLHHLRFWFVLRQAHGMMQDRLERRLKKVGSTPEIAMALWILTSWKGETPCTPAELGRCLSREPQSIAGALNRMTKEGLVKRIPKKKGKAYTEIKMTDKGKEVAAVTRAALNDTLKEIHEALLNRSGPAMVRELGSDLETLRDVMVETLGIEIETRECTRRE